MNASGLNQGTSGNLSVRTGEGFLITPSSQPYEEMEPGDIVAMAFDGTYEGRRPSSEWRFHRDILKHRTDVDVVLHCHSTYATTLACHHRPIPAFHYMVGVAGGTTIRCADYATFGTQALSDAALGRTIEKAFWLATEVEALARLYVQALPMGEPPVLDDAEMARVIAQMERMSYGMGPEPDGSADAARPRQGAQ
jgi:L-fuculose-phosphate aldolase